MKQHTVFLMVAVVAITAVTGCAPRGDVSPESLMQRNLSSARSAATVGTIIALRRVDQEQRPTTAVEIATVASVVRGVVAKKSIHLSLVESLIRQQLDKSKLSVEDKVLVESLVDLVRADIYARLGDPAIDLSALDRDSIISEFVLAALDGVLAATDHYVPAVSPSTN